MSDAERIDLALSFAALLLHDGGVEISGENISTVLAAANITVERYWPGLFARCLRKCDVDVLLAKPGSGGNVGGSGGDGAAAATGAGGAAAAKKEEKKKEEEEEEDAGGAGGLFGGDDDVSVDP